MLFMTQMSDSNLPEDLGKVDRLSIPQDHLEKHWYRVNMKTKVASFITLTRQ